MTGAAGSRRVGWRLPAALVLLLLLIAGGIRLFSLLRAATLIYGLSPMPAPRVVRVYIKIFRHATAEADFSVASKNGPVAVRVIFPRDRPQAPIVVLVHGLASDGYRDPLLNDLALRLAQIGLRVVVPNISSEQHRLMRSSALYEIGAAIQWSATASGKRVSLFGISFGGGLAIATAEMPQYANLVNIVFSDAGYNSIERLGRYYIGERVDAPDGRPYTESPPGSGPLLMALQHLDEMVPAEDVLPIEKVILGEALNHSGGPAPRGVLTPSQQRIYDELRTVGSPAMREKYHRLLERHRAEMETISPASHMGGLRAPVYILHGADDNSIPAGETLWTLSEALPGEKVHALITPWMAHAILMGHVSLLKKIWIGNFVSAVLNSALRPESL